MGDQSFETVSIDGKCLVRAQGVQQVERDGDTPARIVHLSSLLFQLS